MSECPHDSLERRSQNHAYTVNRRYTFGNKGHLQALSMGEMPLHVKVQGKEAPIKVTLKDVLWIPGLLFFFF